MNIKENWVSITVIVVVLIIFLLIVFARANEGLDQYEWISITMSTRLL